MSNATIPTASLALNLLRKEIAAHPYKNVVLSPLSISTVFGMLLNGARGNTLEQIAQALGLSTTSTCETNVLYTALLDSLKRPGLGVTLKIANAIFARTGFDFKPDFISANIKHFGAKVDALDFSDPATPDEINAWVSRATKRDPNDNEGMITKLVEGPIDPTTIMFLLNALVFKGEWSVKFDKSLTKSADFTTADGSKFQRDLMYRQSSNFLYQRDWNDDVYQAVVLPFGESKECRQIVITPLAGHTVQDVLAVLTPELLVELCALNSTAAGELWLPRQQLTYDSVLNDTLIQLGMADAFDAGTCDLKELCDTAPGNVYISKVQHKTVFNLDEEGAAGAAVTKARVGFESSRRPFQMRVDRAFLEFTVTKEGDIQFANYVNCPTDQ